MTDNRAGEMENCAHIWATPGEYVVVPVELPDGSVCHDIYRWDGTYATVSDEALNATVVEHILRAGAELVDPDRWVLRQKMREYEPLWTSDRDRYVIVRQAPRFTGEAVGDVIYDRNGKWYPIYEDDVRCAVLANMREAGVELRDEGSDRGIRGTTLPRNTPEEVARRERVLSAVRGVLSGHVSAEMRAVAVELERDGIRLRIYHDGQLEKLSASGTWELFDQTIVPVLRQQLGLAVGFVFERIDAPTAIRSDGELVYARQEDGSNHNESALPSLQGATIEKPAVVMRGRLAV